MLFKVSVEPECFLEFLFRIARTYCHYIHIVITSLLVIKC
jgi:hypothetical protein